MSSPTSRSKSKLEKEGWFVASVEKYNSFVKRRFDLWEFGDLLAFRGDEVLIVQTTSGSNVSSRIEKIKHLPVADHWLQSATRQIHVHGWAKKGPRGKAKRWTCRIVRMGYDDNFGVYAIDETDPSDINNH